MNKKFNLHVNGNRLFISEHGKDDIQEISVLFDFKRSYCVMVINLENISHVDSDPMNMHHVLETLAQNALETEGFIAHARLVIDFLGEIVVDLHKDHEIVTPDTRDEDPEIWTFRFTGETYDYLLKFYIGLHQHSVPELRARGVFGDLDEKAQEQRLRSTLMKIHAKLVVSGEIQTAPNVILDDKFCQEIEGWLKEEKKE